MKRRSFLALLAALCAPKVKAKAKLELIPIRRVEVTYGLREPISLSMTGPMPDWKGLSIYPWEAENSK